MKSKRKPKKDCANCGNALYVGEGDTACITYQEGLPEAKLILDDWTPTDDYFWCDGKCWELNE